MNKYLFFGKIIFCIISIQSVLASDRTDLADGWTVALNHTTEFVPFQNVSDSLKKELFSQSNVPSLISDRLKSDTIVVTYELINKSGTCYTNIYISDNYRTIYLILENTSKVNHDPDAEYKNEESMENRVKFVNLTHPLWVCNPDLTSPAYVIQYYRINDIEPIPLHVLKRLRRNNVDATYVSVRITRLQSNDFKYDPFCVVIPSRS